MTRNLYKTDKWEEYRLQVIELDGYACVQCKRGAGDDVVLQVHHKHYVAGRKPWEYPHRDCETLCSGCHAREHGLIKPDTGWSFAGEVEDLGGVEGNCENCGADLRYLYLIDHQDWEPMWVGTLCCDNLTMTKKASEHRRMLERRKRFVKSKRWKDFDGYCTIKQSGINVLVSHWGNQWRISMNGLRGRKRLDSLIEAKRLVFDVINDGSAQKAIEKHIP